MNSTLVPQARLLFWFAVIVLPFSALGALYEAAAAPALVLVAGLLVVAAFDAALAARCLDGLAVVLPPVLRFSAGRNAVIEVEVKNPGGRARPLRMALALPAALRPEREEQDIRLPDGAEASCLPWACLPLRRGRFQIARAHLESPSRLGLWALRRAVPVRCEVRVYPNLQRERRGLAALFLNRGSFGLHAQRQVGKGRDFEKLREYIPGDSFDEIHWKATAKRSHPVTKIFQIERTQEIYIVVDASRLSARPAGRAAAGVAAPGNTAAPAGEQPEAGPSLLERFITSALVLAQAAEHQGDLFGLITFTDGVKTFLRARNGTQHYAACRDALYTLEAENAAPDFDDIVAFLRTRLRRRALLVFLTSLDDPMLAESFTRNMALLGGQHLVLANMIQPPDVAPLFTRDDVASLDDLYRHLGGHLQWHRLQELQRVLQHRGVRFALLDQERMAVELVSQYLSVKQRQIL